jgi:formamidopyrimidine-DNA glycosylase
MPELPEVETFKRYLESTALHKRVEGVTVVEKAILDSISEIEFVRRVKGHRLEDTSRHGKYLFVRLDAGGEIVFHFGMDGRFQYYKAETDRPEYAKLILDLENSYHFAYVTIRKLGFISLVEERFSFIREKELGPDVLNVEQGQFVMILSGRRGTIKSALMNQAMLAGIGNIYSDEILFQAGILPSTEVSDLSDQTLIDLYTITRKVLEKGIEVQGDVEKLPDSYIIPRREKGGVCPLCGAPLQHTTIGGRTSYFCPKDQNHGS